MGLKPGRVSITSEDFYFALLRISTAQLLRAIGFDRTSPSVLDTITDILIRFMELLAKKAKCSAELCNRHYVEVTDVRIAMERSGILHDVFNVILKPLHLHKRQNYYLDLQLSDALNDLIGDNPNNLNNLNNNNLETFDQFQTDDSGDIKMTEETNNENQKNDEIINNINNNDNKITNSNDDNDNDNDNTDNINDNTNDNTSDNINKHYENKNENENENDNTYDNFDTIYHSSDADMLNSNLLSIGIGFDADLEKEELEEALGIESFIKWAKGPVPQEARIVAKLDPESISNNLNSNQIPNVISIASGIFSDKNITTTSEAQKQQELYKENTWLNNLIRKQITVGHEDRFKDTILHGTDKPISAIPQQIKIDGGGTIEQMLQRLT